MHPLFSVAMSNPGLLLAHASAYADLASVELEEAFARHRRRFLISSLMWLLALLAFALSGLSFMFHVAMGHALPEGRELWLWLPPVLSVAGALGCGGWLYSQDQQATFPQLRQQVRQDIAWLQTQEAPHA